MAGFKIVSLNVRQGGRRHARETADRLTASRADVLILAEMRASSEPLLSMLADGGFAHQALPASGLSRQNSVVVLSRSPLRRATPSAAVEAGVSCRWVEAEVAGVRIVAIHIPLGKPKPPFWRAVQQAAQAWRDVPSVIIGDLNTGDQHLDRERGTPFSCADDFAALSGDDLGWTDAWRAVHGSRREYSWYSSASNGFRLDHAFVSPLLAERLVDCRYDHALRLAKTTDHSALTVELHL